MAEKTLDDLQRMLRAREGKPGMAANVALIKERIADLQAPTTLEADELPPSIKENASGR